MLGSIPPQTLMATKSGAHITMGGRSASHRHQHQDQHESHDIVLHVYMCMYGGDDSAQEKSGEFCQ